MDLALLVYSISVLAKLAPALAVVIFVSILAFAATMIYRLAGLSVESWDSEKTRKEKLEARPTVDKWAKRIFAVFTVALLLEIAIPSEKTAYMMVGAYATQKVAENEKVQETGKKVLTIIEQKLDAYIEEGIKKAEGAVTKETKK